MHDIIPYVEITPPNTTRNIYFMLFYFTCVDEFKFNKPQKARMS